MGIEPLKGGPKSVREQRLSHAAAAFAATEPESFLVEIDVMPTERLE
jgi:hypothetical protein